MTDRGMLHTRDHSSKDSRGKHCMDGRNEE